jgi:hypothetical protein
MDFQGSADATGFESQYWDKKLLSKRLSTIKYLLFRINEWHKSSGFSVAFLGHSSWKDIYFAN